MLLIYTISFIYEIMIKVILIIATTILSFAISFAIFNYALLFAQVPSGPPSQAAQPGQTAQPIKQLKRIKQAIQVKQANHLFQAHLSHQIIPGIINQNKLVKQFKQDILGKINRDNQYQQKVLWIN